MNIKEINDSYIYCYNRYFKYYGHKPTKTMSDHMIFILPKLNEELLDRVKEAINCEWYGEFLANPKEYFPCGNFTIYADEKDFNFYAHYVSVDNSDGFTYTMDKVTCATINDKPFIDKICMLALCRLIACLNYKDTYLGEKRVSVKKISGKEIVIPVTYVSSKKNLRQDGIRFGHEIDWKHSWEVIGHWRNISGIGKDRSGKYNQIGKTWVNPAVKGKGDLIKKVRVIN